MKFILASLLLSTVHGFNSPDPYTPLLHKLTEASSSPIATPPPPSDQQKLLNVLSSTLESANNALVASAQVSNLRPTQPLPIMAEMQSKLSTMEIHLHDIRTGVTSSSSDNADLDSLYNSLNSVLDSSALAAEQAAQISKEVVDQLVDFNVALGHSMSSLDGIASLIPGDAGAMFHSQLGEMTDGLLDGVHSVDWNDAGLQSFLAALDRKFDDLSLDSSPERVGLLVGYGVVAFMMGYAQNMSAAEYKLKLREKLNNGVLDIDELAKEVGYTESKMAPTVMPSFISVDYDAAVRLAYKASGKTTTFDSFKAKYLIETSQMVAKKNPYLAAIELMPTTVSKSQAGLTSVEYDAAAKLAYQDSNKAMSFDAFKAKYLLETSAMVATKNPYTQNKPTPPTHDISAESFMKQPMVKVVQKPKPKPKLPPASPLARLLAEELGLELTTIGKGSGKNGKILIEDVRSFQSKIEKARDAIAKKRPYFATANV